MDVCYCANYYSLVRCTNTVGKFGQRCKLCHVLKSGTSLSPGMLPDDCLWVALQPQRNEERDDRSEKSMAASRRPSWTFVGMSLSASTKKATSEVGLWKNARTNTRM